MTRSDKLELRTQKAPIFSIVAILLLLSFSIGHTIQGHTTLAVVEAVCMAGVGVTLLIHRRWDVGNKASGVGLSFLITGLLTEFHVSGLMAAFWLVLFPVPVFSILGWRAGSVFAVVWTAMLGTGMALGLAPEIIDPGLRLTVVLAFAVSCVLSLRQEILRARQFRRIRHLKREAEAAAEAKARFMSQVSHEFRTPLNAVMGFTQLMEHRGELGEQDKALAAKVKVAGGRLTDLVEQLIEFSDKGEVPELPAPASERKRETETVGS